MKKLTMIVAALALMAGCGDDKKGAPDAPEGGGGNLTSLKNSNLANTRTAFLTGGVATRAEDGEEPKIYKVGIDGQTQTVTFTDQDGVTVDAVVEHIQSLSQKFAVMRVRAAGASDALGQSNECVFVVRKSDGKLFTDAFTLENGYTSWTDSPLGLFTWQEAENDPAFNYSNYIKIGADGDLYYLLGNSLGGSPLNHIWEQDGQVRFSTTSYDAHEYWVANPNGDVLGEIDNNLRLVWYDKNGTERARSGWFVNMGLGMPEIEAGVPFALSYAPGSFFTVDNVFAPPSGNNRGAFLHSVLARYDVEQGEVVRNEVYTFDSEVDFFGPTLTNSGTALFTMKNPHEICVFTDPENVKYLTIEDGSNFYNGVNYQFNKCSNRYVYSCVDPANSLPRNVISRIDSQTAIDEADYYELPEGYDIQWFTVSHDDVLTICARHNGKNEFIEVSAAGTETIRANHEGKKVTHQSAF